MDLAILFAVLTVLCMTSAQPAIPPRPNPGGAPRVPNIPSIPSIPRASRPRVFPAANQGSPRRGMATGNANSQQNSACASAGRNAIAQCFQNNGGFQMQQIIALMSRGAQGSVPGNAMRVTEAVCAKEGTIIACMFEGVNSLENTAQCPTQSDFTRLEQETVNLITGVQMICGKGPLPAATPCLTDLNLNLKACFREVDIDPGVFTPSNAFYSTGHNLTQALGAIIGRDEQAAGKFCRSWFSPKMKGVKQRLFQCMQTVMDRCEGSSELVAMSGFEPESLKKGIEVLCHDVNVYVDGLKCFQRVPPEVERCYDDMKNKVTTLTAQQVVRSMPLSQFYDKFCQARIQHMECDLQAWRKQCSMGTVGLKNEFECNLLPTRCKNDRSLQGRLQQTCAIKSFHRHLRSSAIRPLSVSALIMTLTSVVLVFIL